jgi:hypothetical protein
MTEENQACLTKEQVLYLIALNTQVEKAMTAGTWHNIIDFALKSDTATRSGVELALFRMLRKKSA